MGHWGLLEQCGVACFSDCGGVHKKKKTKKKHFCLSHWNHFTAWLMLDVKLYELSATEGGRLRRRNRPNFSFHSSSPHASVQIELCALTCIFLSSPLIRIPPHTHTHLPEGACSPRRQRSPSPFRPDPCGGSAPICLGSQASKWADRWEWNKPNVWDVTIELIWQIT